MDQIVLSHVTKTFTTKTLGTVTAVNDFNLTIKEGECFSFLGPSGCGKTTTLRMIAGFEDLSQGEIHLCGKPVSIKSKNLYVPPEDRGLGMVFQSFAVWPHMNIFENVAFPLRVRKVPKAEMAERVKMALKHTSLDGMEKVYPGNLSGGQQQRIALARAIVTNPKVMLLDEPLSNLDPKLRETMRFEIKELQKKFNFTIIFVTHDQSEAMALSDRMMVMDMGNIVQIGTPTELYNRPVNRFVHKFLGQSTFTDVILQDGKARGPSGKRRAGNGHGHPAQPDRHEPHRGLQNQGGKAHFPDQLHRVSGARRRPAAAGADPSPQCLCSGRNLLPQVPGHHVVRQGRRSRRGGAQPPPAGVISFGRFPGSKNPQCLLHWGFILLKNAMLTKEDKAFFSEHRDYCRSPCSFRITPAGRSPLTELYPPGACFPAVPTRILGGGEAPKPCAAALFADDDGRSGIFDSLSQRGSNSTPAFFSEP